MLECQEGEYGYYFLLTVEEDDGDAYGFAGTETISLKIIEEGETAITIGTGSINDADNGIVQILVASDDVSDMTEGMYTCQVVITDSGMKLLTETFDLRIGRGI